MATLADLFNEKSQDIYKRFSPSSGQLVTVKPDTDGVFGSRSRIKNDNRSIPTVSVLRDTKRVSKFLASAEGVLFLSKQALLQTGNTFVNTKLYNPASPLLNVVPFLHTKRHFDTRGIVPNGSGLLQNNTVLDASARFDDQTSVVSLAKSYISTQLKKVANTIIPLPQVYKNSRPEYTVFGYGVPGLVIGKTITGPRVFKPQPLYERGSVRLSLNSAVRSKLQTAVTNLAIRAAKLLTRKTTYLIPVPPERFSPPKEIPTFVEAAKTFRNNQKKRSQDRLNSKYFTEQLMVDKGAGESVLNEVGDVINGSSPSIKDPYNIARKVPSADKNIISYKTLNTPNPEEKTDIIKFIFSDVEGNNPVYFRALLSAIKESIKTEFSEQRYVGRTERFVTYGGAKRALNLSFNIVAFSQKELAGVWTKVNYLSGLAFPNGVKNGFMVPPFFKLTIGGIYDNQPCYIESLDYDFLDESITFDIDQEVPFAINVTMQLSLLEKRSKFFDSPFYKITEDIANYQATSSPTVTNISRIPPNAPNTTVGLPANLPVSDLRLSLTAPEDNPEAVTQRISDLFETQAAVDYTNRLSRNEPDAVMEFFRRKTAYDAAVRASRF